MENIFAPWRMAYIEVSKKQDGCIFCDFPPENRDEERLILYRGSTCFVIFNAFPYNPGHLMVAPYRHTADFDGHLLLHVVPRWNGDTNFMPVFADVRVVAEELAATYARMKKAWNE